MKKAQYHGGALFFRPHCPLIVTRAKVTIYVMTKGCQGDGYMVVPNFLITVLNDLVGKHIDARVQYSKQYSVDIAFMIQRGLPPLSWCFLKYFWAYCTINVSLKQHFVRDMLWEKRTIYDSSL